jgi:hypothetical protein
VKCPDVGKANPVTVLEIFHSIHLHFPKVNWNGLSHFEQLDTEDEYIVLHHQIVTIYSSNIAS